MSKTTEYLVKKWGERPQIDLAKEISKRKGGDYVSYKGYVNKWFKHTQDPGKEYLLDLSMILNVSVESIIRGEDIVCEYADRPTAYSAAKTGNEFIIDRLFGNSESDVRLTTTDEYGKSFVDYVIEFNNYKAFKIAIEKGYGYPVKYAERKLELIFNGNGGMDNRLTEMIIDNDDIDLFIQAFGADWNGDKSQISVFYNHNILTKENIKIRLLKTKNILEWLTKVKSLSNVERKQFGGNWELTEEKAHLKSIVYNIPSVVCGFNDLLDMCIVKDDNDMLKFLLDQGTKAVNALVDVLGENGAEFEIVPFTNALDMVIQLKNKWRGCPLGFVPYVSCVDIIKDDKLKEKADKINQAIDQLRK